MWELPEIMVKAKERRQLVKKPFVYLAPNFANQCTTKFITDMLLLRFFIIIRGAQPEEGW